jgi:hypothetical protein
MTLGTDLKRPTGRPQPVLSIASGQQVDSFGDHHQGSSTEEWTDSGGWWPRSRERTILSAWPQMSDEAVYFGLDIFRTGVTGPCAWSLLPPLGWVASVVSEGHGGHYSLLAAGLLRARLSWHNSFLPSD